jgi:hypothetical protein
MQLRLAKLAPKRLPQALHSRIADVRQFGPENKKARVSWENAGFLDYCEYLVRLPEPHSPMKNSDVQYLAPTNVPANSIGSSVRFLRARRPFPCSQEIV